LYNAYAVSVTLTSTQTSSLTDGALYYVGSPFVLLSVSDLNGELNVLVNDSLVKTVTADGNYLLGVPSNPFELQVVGASSTLLDQNITPVRLSLASLAIVPLTSQPSEDEPVRMRLTLTNDNTEDSLDVSVEVSDGNTTVYTDSYEVELPAGQSITKYFSFVPQHAGTYTVRVTAEEHGLTVAQQTSTVQVSVARPDVSLSVSPTELTLPSDVVATVNIQNGPVDRHYTVALSVYGPDGSQVYTKQQSVDVAAGGTRSIVFSVSLGADYPPGPYTFLAHVSFTVDGQTYSTDAQRVITAASDVPSLALSIRTPDSVAVDKVFRFVANFRHQSTKTYTYHFQCRVYGPDGIPLLVVPSVPADITLQPKEVTSTEYQFTVPSDWQSGTYSISCRAWTQGGEWTDEKQFKVQIPSDFVTFFIRAYMKDGKVHASACYSTEALKPLQGTVVFKYYGKQGVLSLDGPMRVTMSNRVQCVDSSWAPPAFVDPRSIKVSATLQWSGGDISQTADLGSAREDVHLQCDRNTITPEDPKVTCTLYTESQGNAMVGLAPAGVDVPPVYDGGVMKILSAAREVNVDRTAVFTLPVSGVRFQSAQVVAVYRDSEGFVSVATYPVEIVPVAAAITSVQTFANQYYNNDTQKPVVAENENFYQYITVCSRSSDPITIKMVASTPNDLVATALSNTVTVQLAPKQCVTKTFVFRAGRYLPTAPIGITYSLYLAKGGKTYLLGSKTYQGPAPSKYYAIQNSHPVNVRKELVGLVLIGVIAVLGFVYWITRKKRRVEEVTSYEPRVSDKDGPQ